MLNNLSYNLQHALHESFNDELEKAKEDSKKKGLLSESGETFDPIQFENSISRNMRFKEYDIIDNELYWVTQDQFNEEDCKKFQEALKNTKYAKAYVTTRDFSTYNLEEDLKNDVLAIVTLDNIDMSGYLDTCKKYGWIEESELNEEDDKTSMEERLASLKTQLEVDGEQLAPDEKAAINQEIADLEIRLQESDTEPDANVPSPGSESISESDDEAEESKVEDISFQEIIDMMENATSYEELNDASEYIADDGLRTDVSELISQCEEDGDDVSTAYSIVASDLLDSKINDLNVKLDESDTNPYANAANDRIKDKEQQLINDKILLGYYSGEGKDEEKANMLSKRIKDTEEYLKIAKAPQNESDKSVFKVGIDLYKHRINRALKNHDIKQVEAILDAAKKKFSKSDYNGLIGYSKIAPNKDLSEESLGNNTFTDSDEAEYYRNKKLYAQSALARHKIAMNKAKRVCDKKGIKVNTEQGVYESENLKEEDLSKYKVGEEVYWIGAGNEISSIGKIVDFPIEGRMTIKWDDNEVNTYDIGHPNIQLAIDYDESINDQDKNNVEYIDESIDTSELSVEKVKEIFAKMRELGWNGEEATADEYIEKATAPIEYRYITNHGVGPGTLPEDTFMRSEDLDSGKTAIYTNRPLTSEELEKYDIKPEWTQESNLNEESRIITTTVLTKEEAQKLVDEKGIFKPGDTVLITSGDGAKYKITKSGMNELEEAEEIKTGDKYVNPEGGKIEIVNVDKEHLVDDEPQVTYKTLNNNDTKCYKLSNVVSMLNDNKYKLEEAEEIKVNGLEEVKSQGNVYMLKDSKSYIVGIDYDKESGILNEAEVYETKEDADSDYLSRCEITKAE